MGKYRRNVCYIFARLPLGHIRNYLPVIQLRPCLDTFSSQTLPVILPVLTLLTNLDIDSEHPEYLVNILPCTVEIRAKLLNIHFVIL